MKILTDPVHTPLPLHPTLMLKVIMETPACVCDTMQLSANTLVGGTVGLILYGGSEGNCLHAPWSLSWCSRTSKN